MSDKLIKTESSIVLRNCQITKTGMAIAQKLSFRDWEEIGRKLRDVNGSIMFWLGDWMQYGEAEYGEMYAQAIDSTGYDYSTIANAKWVCGQIEFSRRREKLSFSHHREVAGLEQKEQERLLEKAEEEGWDRQDLRDAVRKLKHAEKASQPLPKGKWAVIYADPPWPVESMVLDKWESPLDDKYGVMSLDEIKSLAIADLAAGDCSLFLWTTHTFLPDAFDVIETWGFKYHCCITWDKGSGWSLSGFHRRTEFCLYAYKGNINLTQTGEFIPTVFAEKKGKHSQKPEKMYEFIEQHAPKSRIELFARKKREGWDAWGDQLDA